MTDAPLVQEDLDEPTVMLRSAHESSTEVRSQVDVDAPWRARFAAITSETKGTTGCPRFCAGDAGHWSRRVP